MAMLLPRPAALSSPAPAPAAAAAIHHEGGGGGNGNPANALVAAVNAKLRNSKGLGCMALQYLAHCLATQDISCGTTEGTLCHPPERDITELPTVDLLSARLLGCFTHDNDHDGSALVVTGGANASATVRGKEHAQVGAGVLRE